MSETHFGFKKVEETDKTRRVREVFDSVASRYDLMNDVLSMGLHRAWKAYAVAVADVRPGMKVLDIAGGTGDLALAFAKAAQVNAPATTPDAARGEVWLTDINEKMLQTGRDRLLDKGVALPTAVCDAERLPFASGRFDLVSVAFGLRNMTRKEAALAEMARVLRPGGRVLVLEFSKPAGPLQAPYDFYSFKVMPLLGRLIANDGESYRYLAESIRMHPDQGALKVMMKAAGFGHVDVHNLAAGIVALHVGVKC